MSSPGSREGGERWQALFADLDAEFASADAAELAGEVADRARRERGRQALLDRLRAAEGRPIRLRVRAVGAVIGRLREVGPDWVVIAEEFGREALVPLAAVVSIGGLGGGARVPVGRHSLDARLDLRHALRRLMRDRATVVATLADGSVLTGTLDRVGADFVDVAVHVSDEPRRQAAVREVATVPLTALVTVRSQSVSAAQHGGGL